MTPRERHTLSFIRDEARAARVKLDRMANRHDPLEPGDLLYMLDVTLRLIEDLCDEQMRAQTQGIE